MYNEEIEILSTIVKNDFVLIHSSKNSMYSNFMMNFIVIFQIDCKVQKLFTLSCFDCSLLVVER